MGLEAYHVLRGTRTNPFVTGWFSNPTLYFFMQASVRASIRGSTATCGPTVLGP